jgi:hypothetical protein
MPNVGSWNGKWTGATKQYFLVKSFKDREALAFMGVAQVNSWYYNFGDGWGANVKAEVVDAKEAARRRKVSSGFCGYDWMVKSIIENNKIIVKETTR